MLVWAATEPELRAVGADPHTYLKKQLLWGGLGIVLHVRHRQHRLPPVPAVDAGDLRPVAAAAARGARPVGPAVNGAKAWIALPGGFQVEPSEFAKLGLILGTAWILSRRAHRAVAAADGRPACGTPASPSSRPRR